MSLLILIIKNHPQYNTITSSFSFNCHTFKRKLRIGLYPCYRWENWVSGKLEAPQLVRLEKKNYHLHLTKVETVCERIGKLQCQGWDLNPIWSDSRTLSIFHCVMLPALLLLSPNQRAVRNDIPSHPRPHPQKLVLHSVDSQGYTPGKEK